MLTFKNSVLYYNYIYSGKIREIILDTSLNIAVLMRDYFYTNTSEDYRYRKELANFFEEYPKLTYNSNWSYFIGLSYNKNNTSESIASKRLKVLHKYLNIDKRKSEGIYVTEFDRSFDRIHHHMLLYSELSLSDVTYRVNKYWGKIGRVDVREYDDTKAPCKYVVKHINKSDKNTYDFFM